MNGICNTLRAFKFSIFIHIPPILDVKIPTEGNPAGYL